MQAFLIAVEKEFHHAKKKRMFLNNIHCVSNHNNDSFSFPKGLNRQRDDCRILAF